MADKKIDEGFGLACCIAAFFVGIAVLVVASRYNFTPPKCPECGAIIGGK